MVVDGTRTFAAGPARMDSELSHIAPGNVDSVEVVTGAYALAEGAGAMGAILVRSAEIPSRSAGRRARAGPGEATAPGAWARRASTQAILPSVSASGRPGICWMTIGPAAVETCPQSGYRVMPRPISSVPRHACDP